MFNNFGYVFKTSNSSRTRWRLSVSALENYKDHIKGKTVVCVISGGNNDINRMKEIEERSLLYEEMKHYFIFKFPQRPGALREFVMTY